MSVSFLDLMPVPTLAGLKAKLVSLAQANALPVTAWVPGRPTERWLDITPRMVFSVLAGITTQAVRGFFLDLATDPGDPGDLSADQTPRGGFLSALGEGWYGTTRGQASQATTTLTIQNQGSSPATFSPFDLTFSDTGDAAKADGGRPTYRNSTDAGIYTGIGGTLTLAPGASQTSLPVLCDQLGSYGNASANALSCTTQSFGTLVVTASVAAVGLDREAAPLYRARCREAPAAVALGGPEAKYFRAMASNADGTPLQRHDGSGPVNIVPGCSYVSLDSSTGVVIIYFGGLSGGVDSTDVDSANANILGTQLGVITNPIGAVGDCATVGPGSPGGATAINTTIPVTWAGKAKSSLVGKIAPATYTKSGSSASSPSAAADPVFAAIDAALAAYLPALGTGGVDQTAGAGVVYTDDLGDIVQAGYPGPAADGTLRAGVLYNVTLALPAGATTAIGLGHIAVLGTVNRTLVVVAG